MAAYLRAAGQMVNPTPRLIWGMGAALVFVLGSVGVWKVGFSGDPQDTQDMVPVLITTRYVPAFHTITKGQTALKGMPKAYLPPGAFHSIRDLSNDQGQILYVSAVPLPEGQPLTQSLVTEITRSRGLTTLLSPGRMALSIALDRVHGVGGWIQPGDSIALYQSAMLGPGGKPQQISRLLFSNLPVLAVNKNRLGVSEQSKSIDSKIDLDEPSDEGGNVLTLGVNPAEAAVIIHAREQAPLTAALRALGDNDL